MLVDTCIEGGDRDMFEITVSAFPRRVIKENHVKLQSQQLFSLMRNKYKAFTITQTLPQLRT